MSEQEIAGICREAREAMHARTYDKARDLFARAVQRDENSVEAHFGLATTCFILDEQEQALRHFHRVIELDPKRVTAHINVGVIQNRLGNQDDAIKFLRKGIALDPRRHEAYYNLGIAYRQKGMTELAVEAYQQAVRLNPKMVDAFFNLGNALSDLNRTEEAASAYRNALKIKPGFQKAIEKLEQIVGSLEKPAPETRRQPKKGFSSELSRANAIEEIRGSLEQMVGLCRELSRCMEDDMLAAQRELSRCLVGTHGSGELGLHADQYDQVLKRLQATHGELAGRCKRIRTLSQQFDQET